MGKTPRADAFLETPALSELAGKYDRKRMRELLDICRQLEIELAALQRQVEENETDARRYRWLKAENEKPDSVAAAIVLFKDWHENMVLDEAIDAALERGGDMRKTPRTDAFLEMPSLSELASEYDHKRMRELLDSRALAYTSENAEIYRAQDGTIASCAKAIRSLKEKKS